MNTIEILEKLVGFDTTSHFSNLPIINWIADYLQDFGVDAQIIKDSTGEKANLYATIGPETENGIVLSGHTDVVSVEGQDWSSNPFEMTARGSRLYGRGTADMKGFLASVLASVPNMKASALTAPFHIAFSHDEETGCLGVPALIAALPPARAVIVGEPTEFRVIDRHKGAYAEKVDFTGVAAHSSLPQLGVSAIEYCTKLMSEIMEITEWLKQEIQSDFSVDPHYSTINLGTVNAGVAHNIIPDHAELIWQLRCSSTQAPEAVIQKVHNKISQLKTAMRETGKTCDITSTKLLEVSPLKQEKEPVAALLCQQLTGENRTSGVNYGTEAGLFQEAGFSAAVCGPGNIEQAHKPDEYIEIEQLATCDRLLDKLVKTMSN